MGAQHSSESRSVSMDNPSPAGVIDVSDDVVHRLKKGINKQARETTTAAAPAPVAPVKQERPVPIKQVLPAPPSPAPARTPTIVYQNPPSIGWVGAGGSTITAADMRRQKEVELQQNDDMWRQRMANLEQTLKKTNSIMESEYTAAVDDVRKRFATAAPAHQLPPCQDLKAKVIACYRAHPGETLKCAEEVANFRNCVSMNRIKKLEDEKPSAAPATTDKNMAKAA